MNATLELAVAKAAELPEEAQERIGFELLDRLAALQRLRADIDVGIKELDAGLGEELNLEEFLADLNREHASR